MLLGGGRLKRVEGRLSVLPVELHMHLQCIIVMSDSIGRDFTFSKSNCFWEFITGQMYASACTW